MAQLLPLSTSPNQSIRATLTVNGSTLTLDLSVYYNQVGGFWIMNIADQNGSPLVSSVPLLTGVWPGANMLAPYEYMKIGSLFIINQNAGATDWPDNTDLGTSFVALWDDNS